MSQNIKESEYQITRFEKLWVWQKAHKLMLEIHKLTKNLPAEERFKLRSQIERSSSSVPDNIAEGSSCYYYNDKIKSYYNARKEAGETQNHLYSMSGKRYISSHLANRLIAEYEEVIRGLNGLIRSTAEKRDKTKLRGSKF